MDATVFNALSTSRRSRQMSFLPSPLRMRRSVGMPLCLLWASSTRAMHQFIVSMETELPAREELRVRAAGASFGWRTEAGTSVSLCPGGRRGNSNPSRSGPQQRRPHAGNRQSAAHNDMGCTNTGDFSQYSQHAALPGCSQSTSTHSARTSNVPIDQKCKFAGHKMKLSAMKYADGICSQSVNLLRALNARV